jgi:hypothetical protein
VQRYVVALQCLPCQRERLHSVTYLGNVFASVTCTVCGETLRPHVEALVADYVRDFERRLARKPGRMLTRARHHPVSFVFQYLPHGLVSKPREVFAEWATLMRMNQAAQAPPQEDRAEEPMLTQGPYG